MIVVADSGSTKTDWKLIKSDTNELISLQTNGMNPLFISEEDIIKELEHSGISNYKQDIKEVHFYGAGLANEQITEKMTAVFKQYFATKTTIFLNDDLKAAARALFGKNNGIACILGTGSNSCLYLNGQIEDKVPALGYILGDEGSGANMGKKFINALFKRQLPKNITEKILKENDISIANTIENVYKRSFPNKYLASLTQIIIKHLDVKEIRDIVTESFDDFIAKNIAHYEAYQSLQIGFVGSIGFYFSEPLKKALEKHGLTAGPIIKAPIDELISYHKNDIHKKNIG